MYGRWKKTNSPPPSKASRATEDTLELPTLGRKKSKSEPRIKADWELEIERKVKENREKREAEDALRKADQEANNKRIRDRIAETQRWLETSHDLQSKVDATLGKAEEAKKAIDAVNDKFEDWSQQWDEALTGSLAGLASLFPGTIKSSNPEPISELQELYGAPQHTLTAQSIAEKINQRKSICVLVGEDVTPNPSSTRVSTFEKAAKGSRTPLELWKHQEKIKQDLNGTEPNNVHHAAAQLVHFFNSTNRSGSVITLNIDGFDRKMSLGEEVYELNGNLDFMRCSKPCNMDLYPSILNTAQEITKAPTCPRCKAPYVPFIHKLGQDQSEEFYQSKTVEQKWDDADVVVILGSQCKWGISSSLAARARKRQQLVLECNTTPIMQFGKVMVNTQPLLESFPEIVEKVMGA